MPAAVRKRLATESSGELSVRSGDWSIRSGVASVVASDSYADVLGPMLDRPALVGCEINFEPGTRGCGLLITTGEGPDDNYVLRLEPMAGRLVFDRWPRR